MKVPLSWGPPWNAARSRLSQEPVTQNMQVRLLDAVDGSILTKYWQQAGCKDSILTALMQYDAGQDNVPR